MVTIVRIGPPTKVEIVRICGSTRDVLSVGRSSHPKGPGDP